MRLLSCPTTSRVYSPLLLFLTVFFSQNSDHTLVANGVSILPVICSDCCKILTDTECGGLFTFCNAFKACRGGCRCPELTAPINVGQDGGSGCAPTDKDDCVVDEALCLQGISMRNGDPVTVSSQLQFCVSEDNGGSAIGVLSPSAAPTFAPSTATPTLFTTSQPTPKPAPSSGSDIDTEAIFAGLGTVAGCGILAIGIYFAYNRKKSPGKTEERKSLPNPVFWDRAVVKKGGKLVQPRRRSLLRSLKPPPGSVSGFTVGSSVFDDSELGNLMEAGFDFEAEEEDELALKKGEVVRAIRKVNEEWMLVQNESGQQGIVPSSYLIGEQDIETISGYAGQAPTVVSTKIGFEVDERESNPSVATDDELF